MTQEPSCSQDGMKTYTCTADGCTNPAAIKTEEPPRLPHMVVNDPAVAAACKTPGKTAGSHCSVCNEVILAQKETPALGHKEVVDPAVAATCTAPGKTEGKHCSVCDTVITAQEVVAALGHTEVTDPAVAVTCTTPGKTEGKHCSVCNAIITAQETIAALGHDLTGTYQNDASSHWHKCIRCEVTDTKAVHTYNTTDCAQAATCTVCTYEKTAGTHTWGEWSNVDEANHKHTCSSCNTEESAAHTWDAGVVTTEPTETIEGVKIFTCSACQGTKTESIPVVSKLTLTFAGDPFAGFGWTAVDGAIYCVEIKEGNTLINKSTSRIGFSYANNFAFDLTENKDALDVFLYKYDEQTEQAGELLTSALGAINVVVTSDVVKYTMENSTTQPGKGTLTIENPDGIYAYVLTDKDGKRKVSGTGASPITLSATFEDGDIMLVRKLSGTVVDNKLTITMSATSQKAYVAPVVPENITLTQDESGAISVTWDAVDGITDYALDIVTDSQASNPSHPFLSRTQPSSPRVDDLRPHLPQVAETTQGLTIIVYTCNSDYSIKDEIGRLTNVLDITIAGEAVEYTIDYNTPDADKHKVTITKGATDYYVSNWHNKLGQKIFFGFNFIRDNGNETTEQKKLSDGNYFDLRALTSFVMENNKISATITPQSKNTYTISGTE